MISFKVVMGSIFVEHMVKCSFAKENHSVQTFGFHSGRAADKINRSAYAFKFGERGGSFAGAICAIHC